MVEGKQEKIESRRGVHRRDSCAEVERGPSAAAVRASPRHMRACLGAAGSGFFCWWLGWPRPSAPPLPHPPHNPHRGPSQSAILLFEMLGNMILDRPRRRRSLLTGGSLDLTDADSIASFLSQAQGMLSSTAATSSMRAVGWVPCSWDATRLALTLRARPCPVAGPEDSGHALAPAAAAASPRNTFTAFASITTPSCSRWPRRWRC